MLEPPPRPTMRSGAIARTRSTQRHTEALSGSGMASAYTRGASPAPSSTSSTRRSTPAPATPGSVNSATRVPPRRATTRGNCRRAPLPNTICPALLNFHASCMFAVSSRACARRARRPTIGAARPGPVGQPRGKVALFGAAGTLLLAFQRPLPERSPIARRLLSSPLVPDRELRLRLRRQVHRLPLRAGAEPHGDAAVSAPARLLPHRLDRTGQRPCTSSTP